MHVDGTRKAAALALGVSLVGCVGPKELSDRSLTGYDLPTATSPSSNPNQENPLNTSIQDTQSSATALNPFTDALALSAVANDNPEQLETWSLSPILEYALALQTTNYVNFWARLLFTI